MFRTPLTEDEESKFKLWVFLNKVPFQDEPTADYDMRGYWKALMRGDPLAVQAGNGHYPDIWKTPFHKTFSNESMYALPGAPRWQGNQLITKDGQVLRDESPRLKPPLFSELLGHTDLKSTQQRIQDAASAQAALYPELSGIRPLGTITRDNGVGAYVTKRYASPPQLLHGNPFK